MKTLIEVNKSLLSEYDDWNENPDNKWDIGAYLNNYYDLNTAIAFSKLYFPDFVEKDGCIILDFRYDKDIFQQWSRHYNGNIKEIEFMCNHFDVQDYFSFNDSIYPSDEDYLIAVNELGKILKKAWTINLTSLFRKEIW